MDANEKSDAAGCVPIGSAECLCRAAVVRAFEGMTISGAPYDAALAVAVRVFHHHHPEFETGASELVERWISPESVH